MAYLIPNNLGSRSDVPAAVQQLATAFRELTDDDVTVVWDVDQPDGAIEVIDPHAGVLIIDVVEGGARGLSKAPSALGRLLSQSNEGRGVREDLTANAQAIYDRLRDSAHLNREVPVRAVLAVPAASRAQVAERGYPAEDMLTKDDFTAASLRDGVVRLLGGQRAPLKEREERAVRAAVTPRIIIRDQSRQEADASGQLVFQAPDTKGEDTIAVLDREQQHLAMHLGDGYRVLRGVAGSGKSLVLTHRARFLAESLPNASILLTCFNIVIGRALAHQLADLPNVEVRHIDSLAYRICNEQGSLPPSPGKYPGPEHFVRTRQAAIASQRKASARFRYDVVLVDEAQDFDNAAFDLAYSCLKPDRQDFVVALDAAQNIYRKRARWNPPGATARGRTRTMQRNYRNTKEILELAYGMLSHGAEPTEDEGGLELDDPTVVVPPEASARRGRTPEVVQAGSDRAEIDAVLEQLQRWHADGVAWSDMLVLFGDPTYQGKLYHETRRLGIPYFCISHSRKNRVGVMDAGDAIRSSNLQTIKGLEFSHVAICGVNRIRAGGEEDEVGLRRLLYVGMTRATDELFVTVSGSGTIGHDLLRASA